MVTTNFLSLLLRVVEARVIITFAFQNQTPSLQMIFLKADAEPDSIY